MADNIAIDQGDLATDLIAGVIYPRGKVGFGVDGSYVDVSASNPLPISDAGGSLTVDGTVAATQSGGWTVSTTGVVNVVPASPAAGSYLPVRLTDGTSFYTASGGSGGGADQQYAEDSVHVSGDLGTVALAVRKDTAAQLAGTDGDYSVLLTDASGRLHVNVGNTVTVSLPTGAATAANQATANTSLAAINAALAAGIGVTLAGPFSGAGGLAVSPASQAAAAYTPVRLTDGTGFTPSLAVTNAGTFAVQATQSGTWTVQPGNTANTTPWLVSLTPVTSGGLSVSKVISAATTNATSVKASAGQLYGYAAFNTNASSWRYLKFYNKASSPTVGTDTPVMVIGVPPSGGANVPFPNGVAFGTGLALAITGGMADNDTTAISATEVVVNVTWK